MNEREVIGKLESIFDKYLKRDDTPFGKILKRISPLKGEDYLQSRTKRNVDRVIALPAAMVTTPVIVFFSTISRIETGSGFYIQQRVTTPEKTAPIIKIRSMKLGSSEDVQANLQNQVIYGRENDPRNTRLGRFMRKRELEEIPQLWQVVLGQWALTGIRSAPTYVFDHLSKVRKSSFENWKAAYFSGRPGIVSLNAVMNPNRKDDSKRHHFDVFYAKKANLGLDLFILYKATKRIWSESMS